VHSIKGVRTHGCWGRNSLLWLRTAASPYMLQAQMLMADRDGAAAHPFSSNRRPCHTAM